jgi:hypothetical protein
MANVELVVLSPNKVGYDVVVGLALSLGDLNDGHVHELAIVAQALPGNEYLRTGRVLPDAPPLVGSEPRPSERFKVVLNVGRFDTFKKRNHGSSSGNKARSELGVTMLPGGSIMVTELAFCVSGLLVMSSQRPLARTIDRFNPCLVHSGWGAKRTRTIR